jgi:hypothetical protein
MATAAGQHGAVWLAAGGFGAEGSSNSSSPHALNAEAQHRLDEIFKAHLPEFINILSQVLRRCTQCYAECFPFTISS